MFIEDLPSMLTTKFQYIWPRGFRGEDYNVKPIPSIPLGIDSFMAKFNSRRDLKIN
jgi:hypothetical protein